MFIEHKTLLGKVYIDESMQKSGCPIYSVDCFDTSTEADICFNKEMVKKGHAWPDPLPPVSEAELKEKKLNIKSTTPEDDVYTDIIGKKVIDGGYFWGHVGGREVQDKISEINQLLTQWWENNDIEPLESCSVGQSVCFCKRGEEEKLEWFRGHVHSVLEGGCVSVIAVDHGGAFKLSINQLYPLPKDIKALAYKASLCSLKAIQAVPKRTKVLEYAAGILTNVMRVSNQLRFQVNQVGGGMALLQLCQLPSKTINLRAVQALTNLARNRHVRPMIGA